MPCGCAVRSTRKSTDEGLDQEYNSIDAQRCRPCLHRQPAPKVGFRWRTTTTIPPSGGNMERPALRRTMADIEAGKIDVVAIYKIDRPCAARGLPRWSRCLSYGVSSARSPSSSTRRPRWQVDAEHPAVASPSSSARSLANASATRSQPASARAWMGGVPLATTSRTADRCPTNARPN